MYYQLFEDKIRFKLLSLFVNQNAVSTENDIKI